MVVQRSTNGTDFSTIALLGNGATSYDDATAVSGTRITFTGVQEVYGAAATMPRRECECADYSRCRG